MAGGAKSSGVSLKTTDVKGKVTPGIWNGSSAEASYVVKRLQSDGGGEYAANENARVLSDCQKICLEQGIDHFFCATYAGR